MNSKKILFDWGGTISRDRELFLEIVRNSGNSKIEYEGPWSWTDIKSIGKENYFSEIQGRFFSKSMLYPESKDVINNYKGNEGVSSKTQTYIVFDMNPSLDMEKNRIQFLLAEKLASYGVNTNGIYVEADKLALCKRLKINVAVEDDPRIALSLASAGIKVYLISRLWNRNFDLNNLNLFVTDRRYKDIENNLEIVEDWFDLNKKLVQLK